MTQALRWDLYGNDHLSETMSKLAKAADATGNGLDKATDKAQRMGRTFGDAERQVDRLGDQMDQAGRQAQGMTTRVAVADKTASGMHSTVSRVGGVLATAGTAVASFSLAAVVGFGLAAGAAGAYGIQIAASNETAMVSFTQLLGTQEKASAFLNDLKGFSAATPFDLPTLREAASKLLAVGVNANQVIPLMTRLGDATAGMGTGAEGIGRAVYALQQIKQSGVAQMDDLNQLSDAGIPIIDALAAHFHTTAAKIRKEFAPKGLITADDVYGAILNGEGSTFGRLEGMMSEQSKTLEGIWSSFKDNAGQALASFMEPALPGLKKGVDWLATNVPKALDYLKDFGGRIKDVFKDSPIPQRVMDALKETGEKILPKIKETFDLVVQVVKDNKEGLEDFGRFISDVVIPVGGELIVLAFRIGSGLAIIGIKILTLVVPALRFMVERFLDTFYLILHGADETFGWIPGLGDKLKTSASEFDTWAAKVRAKMDELDGKTVDVMIRASVLNGTESFGAAPTKRRAAGGWGDAGDVVRVGEQGPETVVFPRAGYVIPAGGAMPGGGGGESVGHATIMLEGQAVWQGMLRFKGRTGKRSLGLA